MKLTTECWLKLESRGYPAHTVIKKGNIRDHIFEIGRYIIGVQMGSKIVVTLARTESELSESKRAQSLSDIEAEFDRMMNGKEA